MKDLKTIRGMPDLYDEEVERISIVEKTCLENALIREVTKIAEQKRNTILKQ